MCLCVCVWHAGLWLLNKHESGGGFNVGQKSDKVTLDTSLSFDDIAGIDDCTAQVSPSPPPALPPARALSLPPPLSPPPPLNLPFLLLAPGA